MKTNMEFNTIAVTAMIAYFAVESAQGSVSITIAPQGGDVVMSASGSLNLTALTLIGGGGTSYAYAGIRPSEAWITTGVPGAVDLYQLVSGPSNFGSSGTYFEPEVASGDVFGVIGGGSMPGLLLVPFNYVSGTPLTSTATFSGATLSSLGVQEGTYVWSWGTSGSSDSLSLTVIPEPTCISIMAVSVLTYFSIRTRSRTIRG